MSDGSVKITMKNVTQLNRSARSDCEKYLYVKLYGFILPIMFSKCKNFSEAIKAYCVPKFFSGEAIANPLLAQVTHEASDPVGSK